MTGEISLRGKVLPVGGIREKILAARRHGVLHIVLPAANRVDVEEIPEEYTEGMRFDYAEEVLTVLEKGLERPERAEPEKNETEKTDALEGVS